VGLILNIETSTKTCSVNLSDKGKVIENREISSEKYIHGEKLHLLIQELFIYSKISIEKLNAVAVSSGPGSFTGLRIGVSAAKGLSFALNIPLISMNAIEIMIQKYNMISTNEKAIFFPMIDARRNDVYTAGYNIHKTKISDIHCPEIDEVFINTNMKYNEIVFLGEGATKFKEKFKSQLIRIDDSPLNSSIGMVNFTYQKYLKEKFENISYFNPFYFKDFQPNQKKIKKILS
tara:strand:+ start:7105 stop:7803 length:699 start_codon:yes stop_codon:yes gene_type:complete